MKAKTKRNPQDLTRRNAVASRKRDADLALAIAGLTYQVRTLQRELARVQKALKIGPFTPKR